MDSTDLKSWLKQLECPQSYISDDVIHILQKGVVGLLWEDLSKTIKPISEVSEVRKNIILYKLKFESKDPGIQSIRNCCRLRDERKKFDNKIKKVEEQWRNQEFVCRQKKSLLEKRKAERENLELKKEILKIKHEQMLMQIENCAKMQEICQHLMPPTIEEIQQSTILECLSLVSNYSGGPEKRKVWNIISESLGSVKIPVLWNALLAARSYYTDLLIQLDIQENQENRKKTTATMDIGIAKFCGEHINNVGKSIIHAAKTKNTEIATIKYIEKIEDIIERQRPDLNDWLPLALEVKKLEILHNELQRELEKLREELPIDNAMVDNDLMQLIIEIKTLDQKTADYVQEIQNAFGLLKSSGTLITKTKESLLTELEKFQLLQENQENQWINIDLNTELFIFQNNIDINALRKIMLKGESGVYKHLQACFNKASTAINSYSKSNKISNFPILRMPIYYLIDLYKTFITNASLNKQISESNLEMDDDFIESPIASPTVIASPHHGVFELLRLTDGACERTAQHKEEFEQTLKAWSSQTVREVLSKIFCDKNVYGATLDEWEKRFLMLVYVLQKSNINA